MTQREFKPTPLPRMFDEPVCGHVPGVAQFLTRWACVFLQWKGLGATTRTAMHYADINAGVAPVVAPAVAQDVYLSVKKHCIPPCYKRIIPESQYDAWEADDAPYEGWSRQRFLRIWRAEYQAAEVSYRCAMAYKYAAVRIFAACEPAVASEPPGDSPIEKAFAAEWHRQAGEYPPHQVPIGRYRADFCVGRTVIELDGHEFHSSRQARTHDAERDRFLMQQGYRVVRFTGSEVHADVSRCVTQARSLLV